MRLIDADKFKQEIAGMTIINSYPAEKANACCELINTQLTAYDVDEVVKQLDAYLTKMVGRKSALYQTVIGIVKEGGISESN